MRKKFLTKAWISKQRRGDILEKTICTNNFPVRKMTTLSASNRGEIYFQQVYHWVTSSDVNLVRLRSRRICDVSGTVIVSYLKSFLGETEEERKRKRGCICQIHSQISSHCICYLVDWLIDWLTSKLIEIYHEKRWKIICLVIKVSIWKKVLKH